MNSLISYYHELNTGWGTRISENQGPNVKIEYQRRILAFPVLIVILGVILLFYGGPANPVLGILGSLIVLIGIIVFGAVFSYVVGIEFAAWTLNKRMQPEESFRDRLTDYEQRVKEH
ncbi:MAG: hypothetical protein ACFFE8_16290 [Candidatus Heimdallarchaeota archaeon]